MTSQVLEIFKQISLPCGNDEKVKEKEKKIIKILEEKYPNIYFDLKQGIIIPAETEEKVIIVSHYDLISSFNKGFKNKREPFSLDENGVIQGALDNTITNAVLIWLLLNINKPKNVEILFSNMEEIGCIGMRNYINKIPKEIDKNKKMFFINLDVTNDNWKHLTSVEMDEPIYEVIHFLKDKFEGITTERVGDDLCEVVSAGYKGFSFCLPTKKTIHSWKNKTTLNHLETYINQLKYLIENSDTFLEFAQQDVIPVNISIKEILAISKKELNKKIEEYEEQRTEYLSSLSYYQQSFDFDDDDVDDEAEDYLIEVSTLIVSFFDEHLEDDDGDENIEIIETNFWDSCYNFFDTGIGFSLETLIYNIEVSNKKKYNKYKKLAKDLLNDLCLNKYLEREKVQVGKDEFEYLYSPILFF